jgi:pilus assembly protein CpaC
MNPVRTRIVFASFGICFLGLLMSAMLAPVEAANPKISVAVGQSVTQRVPTTIKTVSIADSDVADVVVAGPREILVNGKKVGFTTLVVWDENNVSSSFNVVVRGAFSNQQIELQVQVAEVDRTKATEFGVDFLFRDNTSHNSWLGASFAGETGPPSIPLTLTSQASMALAYASGGTEIQSVIHALQEDGVLKILAEPNVVAASGQKASFLAGGEYPIPIAQGSGGVALGGGTNQSVSTAITIEFKEYGVKVNFTPTIVDSGVISLQVAPEVSTLDFNVAIALNGYFVPGLQVRKAETTVELEDGQVLVIGGLLRDEVRSTVRRIPILGHIPLIGLFFSNTKKEHNQQELLLVVSPHIVRALPKGTQVTLPGQEKKNG